MNFFVLWSNMCRGFSYCMMHCCKGCKNVLLLLFLKMDLSLPDDLITKIVGDVWYDVSLKIFASLFRTAFQHVPKVFGHCSNNFHSKWVIMSHQHNNKKKISQHRATKTLQTTLSKLIVQLNQNFFKRVSTETDH